MDLYARHPSTDSEYPSDVKEYIIKKGPLKVSIPGHALSLVGWVYNESIGEECWILKDSQGPSFGENGYVLTPIHGGEVTSIGMGYSGVVPPSGESYEVRCVDNDGDGYYNWGIGEKPPTCPESTPEEEDCDDSNPALGPYDKCYHCVKLPNAVEDVVSRGRNPDIILDESDNPIIAFGGYSASQTIGCAVKEGEEWNVTYIADEEASTGGNFPCLVQSGDEVGIIYDIPGTMRKLRFTIKSGDTWAEPVDVTPYHSQRCSATVDDEGVIHLAYIGDVEPSSFFNYGVYTQRIGDAWSTPTRFSNNTTVEAISMDKTSTGPCVAYIQTTPIRVMYTYHNGSDWVTQEVSEVWHVGGTNNISLAVGPGNIIHIAYYSASTRDIRYTFFDGEEWSTPAIVDGDTSRELSIDVASDGTPRICYRKGGDIIYAWPKPDGDWGKYLVAQNVGNHGRIVMKLDNQDKPHIVFADETTGNVRYATTRE